MNNFSGSKRAWKNPDVSLTTSNVLVTRDATYRTGLRDNNRGFRNFQRAFLTGHAHSTLNEPGFNRFWKPVRFEDQCGRRLHVRTHRGPAEPVSFFPFLLPLLWATSASRVWRPQFRNLNNTELGTIKKLLISPVHRLFSLLVESLQIRQTFFSSEKKVNIRIRSKAAKKNKPYPWDLISHKSRLEKVKFHRMVKRINLQSWTK